MSHLGLDIIQHIIILHINVVVQMVVQTILTKATWLVQPVIAVVLPAHQQSFQHSDSLLHVLFSKSMNRRTNCTAGSVVKELQKKKNVAG